MYRNAAKKALMFEMRRVRGQQGQEAVAEDPDPASRIRQVEFDIFHKALTSCGF